MSNQSTDSLSINKYAFWGIQTLTGLVFAIGSYIYTTDTKAQAEFNNKIQNQVLELIKDKAASEQILINLVNDVKEMKIDNKEGFKKLETKIDNLKK